MKLVTKWIKRKEIAKERMAICETCDQFDHISLRCKECGCFMVYKTEWPFADCPLEKWKSYEEEDENGIYSS